MIIDAITKWMLTCGCILTFVILIAMSTYAIVKYYKQK